MGRRVGWLKVLAACAALTVPTGVAAASDGASAPAGVCITVTGDRTPTSVEGLVAGLTDGSIAPDDLGACAAAPVWVAVHADDGRSTLHIGCRGGTAEVSIDWADYVGSRPEVSLRIGDDDPSSSAWLSAPYATVTAYPGDARAFVESLAGRDRLVAQANLHGDVARTVSFALDGLDESLASISKGCDS